MSVYSSLKNKSLTKNSLTIKAPATGSSMMPLIKEHCQLKVKLGEKISYHKGDIALFSKKGHLTAHRIIKVQSPFFILKGDNNPSADGSFTASDFFGKVEKIIYPQYTINLESRANQFLKRFFALYSVLNLKFPFLVNLRKLYKVSFFKTLYRLLVKS